MARVFCALIAIFIACLSASSNAAKLDDDLPNDGAVDAADPDAAAAATVAAVATGAESEVHMGLCSGQKMRVVQDNCQQAPMATCDETFADYQGRYKIKCGVVGRQCLARGPVCA
eukprot:CAMPEP_0197662966 /NCGR_PEP_ID=MMETSP1338-20131121/55561_1 /TAXON_ID=43686 ORGANISM="Pelagodinium beii, Strain RCC1491" /NCGR_SAMPLE_ID=MMETSP1338 /ASSEMBLY_ACC=CAM_ASM_000754 /LENGTH=114 /DNA_ID=CAMNT_0043241099 /DNA_START=60 /DNA_END=404 /DNA_ORIENTATION=+